MNFDVFILSIRKWYRVSREEIGLLGGGVLVLRGNG